MRPESELRSFLEKTFASAGGSLSFERFMELALYHREFGYYANAIADVGGGRADFSTWATLFDLGEPLARWIREEIAFHGWEREKVALVEIGGGDGSLARSILRHLSGEGVKKARYHIVEISGPLRKLQRKALRFRPVRWHETIEDALETCQGRAILFSNELVDAFPARWLRWNGRSWEEIRVRFSAEEGLREDFEPCPDLFDWLPSPVPGQRIEVHGSYRNWLSGWLPSLGAGSLLTIDYGGSGAAIYEGRPAGTMRGYFRQQRVEGGGVYRRFGRQDLTCDVNFDDVRTWGEENGLTTVRLENQAAFLERHRVPVPERAAAEAFQVLHQRKCRDGGSSGF